jgi:hypothetical protein
MNEDIKAQLKEFFKICWSRLEAGNQKYETRFMQIDLLDEITQELADIANYAFLEYVKLSNLKAKATRLVGSDDTT